jgi:hypothetical protein
MNYWSDVNHAYYDKVWQHADLYDFYSHELERLAGEIVGRSDGFRFVVRLNDGTEIDAILPKDLTSGNKQGCLFGSLIGWQVQVLVIRLTPKLARIVELRRPETCHE